MNEHGPQLIDICFASKLQMLNGRTREDFQGDLAYVEYHVCSTVDSVLSSEKTLIDPTIVQYLKILELHVLSDHKHALLNLFASNDKEQCSTVSDFLNSNRFRKKRTTYL